MRVFRNQRLHVVCGEGENLPTVLFFAQSKSIQLSSFALFFEKCLNPVPDINLARIIAEKRLDKWKGTIFHLKISSTRR
jgi:hypothetical protein